MLYLSMKAMQLFPNALGGAMMSLDFLHGKVSSDMVPKLGFPAWFPTALGLFKLAAAALVVSARSGETKRAALGGGLDDGESSGRLQPPPHKRARTQPQRAPRASTPE